MEHLEGDYFIKNNHLLPAAVFDPYLMTAGQSAYEVVRIINDVPLFMEDHLERFKQSAAIINRQFFISVDEILQQMQTLIGFSSGLEGNIKLVLQYDDKTSNSDQNFYAFYIESQYPHPDVYLRGVDTITYQAVRSNPNAKIADLGLRDRVNREIEKQQVFEALLLDNEGYITEGSRSNIFMIKDDCIFTAPLRQVLPGITRCRVLDIICRQKCRLEEKQLRPADLAKMDAVFLTGTSPKVMPIKRVDDMVFVSASNPLLMEIMRQYDRSVADYIAAYPSI
jgi:branched-chain amino acid aminotransferase